MSIQLAQQGVLLSGRKMGVAPPPDKPALADSMFWSATAHATVNLSSRIVNLEPSNSGVDVAFTWQFWIRPSNFKLESNRVLVCGPTTNSNFSYVIGINPQSTQTFAGSGSMVLVLQTSSGNSISITSGTKIHKGRVTHIAFTYSGSELNTGLKLYINGVEDATAVRAAAGSYTGLANDSTARIQFSPVFSSALAFGGDLKDFQMYKSLELNSTQVAEAYNNGVPGTVTSLSYYGSITAYWPMATDLTCTNNAGLNLGSGTNISTRSSNFGSSYESLSFFNGYPPNTRYLGFGQILDVNGVLRVKTRSGSAHLDNGKIVDLVLDPVTYQLGAPTDIIDLSPTQLMCCSWGPIDSNQIGVFAAKFTPPSTFDELDRWESTDGLTGNTYGSAISMTPTLAGYNWYGPVVQRPGTNEYYVMEPEAFGGTYTINIWKGVSGTWTKTQLYSGASVIQEPALYWIDSQKAIIMYRSDTLGGLLQSQTLDGGATWSAITATGVGTGVCNASFCSDPYGNIVMCWMDRGPGYLYVSVGNVPADVLADPTDWNASVAVWQSYSTDSLDIEGYPSIVRRGWTYYISTSAEFSSSRGDQFIGIGRLD